MHHKELFQDYAVLDCCNMPPKFGCYRAGDEVCTDSDTQGRDAVKEGPPRPEVGEGFGCEVHRICGGATLLRRCR
jgi:hypothetical protein